MLRQLNSSLFCAFLYYSNEIPSTYMYKMCVCVYGYLHNRNAVLTWNLGWIAEPHFLEMDMFFLNVPYIKELLFMKWYK